MPHAHVTAARAARGRLVAVLVLSLGALAVEVVGAVAANSLSLLADAGHLLTDVVGIGLALLAIWFAGRPPTLGRTFGYLRVEIIAAVANAILLFGVAGYVVFEAVRRIGDPDIAAGVMFAVALVGLAANGVSVLLLRDAQRSSLNVRGAYLEVLGDLGGSAAVIAAAIVIALTGWDGADDRLAPHRRADPAAHARVVARATTSCSRRRPGTWTSTTSGGTSSTRRASSTATISTPGRSRRA